MHRPNMTGIKKIKIPSVGVKRSILRPEEAAGAVLNHTADYLNAIEMQLHQT